MPDIDYSDMTDEQLNIEVAERRGWRVNLWTAPKPSGFALIAPDGSTIVVSDTPGHAWDNLPSLPANDSNEALAMWEGNDNFNLEPYQGRWCAMLCGTDRDEGAVAYDKNPARAITICWLKYQDAIAP